MGVFVEGTAFFVVLKGQNGHQHFRGPLKHANTHVLFGGQAKSDDLPCRKAFWLPNVLCRKMGDPK